MQHRYFSALWIRSYEDFIYINDELIASSSNKEHHQHLKQLFDGFKDSGVVVDPSVSWEFLLHNSLVIL